MRDLRHLDARAAPDLADWLAFMAVEGKGDRTLYAYPQALKPLLLGNMDKQLGEFTAADINEFLMGVPPRSRYITRSIVNQFFSWAIDDEIAEEDPDTGEITYRYRLVRNPMRGVPRMRQPKRRPKDIFSEAEVELMSRDPLLAIMLTTGLRKSECINLRRSDADLNRARLVVYHGKGDKDRIVPMPMGALQAFAELDLTYGLQGHVFVWAIVRHPKNRDDWSMQKPVGGTTFENWYKRALAAAGVRYLNPHQTRHTYGARLRELGFDLEERQLLMGHESIRTTQHYYGRLTVEDVAAKMAEANL